MPISSGEIDSYFDSDTTRHEPQLSVHSIAAGYGAAPIISSLSIAVGRGEIVSVIGPNGAGKSTLVKAIIGELRVREGAIKLGDEDVTNIRGDLLVRRGIGHVPQVEDVFATMTVRENLEMGAYLLSRREVGGRIDEILGLLPALQSLLRRPASKLSGGQRKMVAIGRALMMRPSVLILDEPTAGLAPQVARSVLSEQVRVLADHGTAVLLIEQKATDALEVSDWAYVLVSGRTKISAPAGVVLGRPDIGELFLGRG